MGKGCKGCGHGPYKLVGGQSSPPEHPPAHDHGHDDHGHGHGEVEREPVYIYVTELQSDYVYARRTRNEKTGLYEWDVEAMLCSTDIRFSITTSDETVRNVMTELENVARQLRSLKQRTKVNLDATRTLNEDAPTVTV